MNTTQAPTLSVGEFHPFEASGQHFAYMVPSAAVFAFDDCSTAVIERLRERPQTPAELLAALGDRFSPAELRDTLTELHRVRAIEDQLARPPAPKIIPLAPMPIQTLVVNVTNQCNLSCEYCYEYGEDKIVDTENGSQPKFMSEETAQAAVDLALREAGVGKTAHITFFGGETLMNFKVLKQTVGYARKTAAEQGKLVDFSLTTNATLLQPDVIDFLADERIGVTISIDGPQEIQDKFRVFSNGKGSYDIAAPKIKALLARHRARPIGARVTLTKQTLDVQRIYKHLFDDMGFWEVGFAPVTTAPQRGHAIDDAGHDDLLAQFRALAAGLPAGVAAEQAPRLLQRPRDAPGDPPRPRQGLSVRRRHRPARRGHRRPGVAVPPLRRLRRAPLRLGHRRHRPGQAGVVPRGSPRRPQDRLQPVLGASDLRRRLLPRGPHALRRHHPAQPALLRVDPRLDPHLPRDLRRARREEPGVPQAVRRRRR